MLTPEQQRQEAVRLFRTLDPEQQIELSLYWERDTGYDSIPTVREHYDNKCVIPGCNLKRKDATEMWIHVHLSRKHPNDPVIMKNLYARMMWAHDLEVEDND